MKILYSFLFLLILCCGPKKGGSNPQPVNGFAVVELFTSEGCSSCPPAEKLLAEIALGNDSKKVLVLEYHVDYWDRLGWKDKFSSAANTQRQQSYVNQFGLNGAYTPQAVVNGSVEFVGSDKTKMQKTLSAFNQPNTETSLHAKISSDNNVLVSYEDVQKNKGIDYVIALVEKVAITNVKTGENGGRELKHVNIVRQFDIVKNNTGTLTFELPEKNKEDYFVVAMQQEKTSGFIKGYSIAAIE
ncbi:hypothetical protein BH10BAC3_BH10BAC3_09200 [soil metagenome]